MSLFSKRYCKICRKPEAQCSDTIPDLIDSCLSFEVRDVRPPEWHPYFDFRQDLPVDPWAPPAQTQQAANIVSSAGQAGGKGTL
jgi:hypothetical protein